MYADLAIEVSGNGQTHEVLRPYDRGRSCFSEVWWGHENRSIGVFAYNCIGGPSELFGYDLIQRARVNDDVLRQGVIDAIRRRYHLPTNTDALQWAKSLEGRRAYERAHGLKPWTK